MNLSGPQVAFSGGGGGGKWGAAATAQFSYAGDPNGHVAALASGDLCVDTAGPALYQASAAGTTSWHAVGVQFLNLGTNGGAITIASGASAQAVNNTFVAAGGPWTVMAKVSVSGKFATGFLFLEATGLALNTAFRAHWSTGIHGTTTATTTTAVFFSVATFAAAGARITVWVHNYGPNSVSILTETGGCRAVLL